MARLLSKVAGRRRRRLPIVRQGLVGNWSSHVDESVVDRTPNRNHAVVKSGIYISSDGVADKLVNADCSGEGSGIYRLTGMVRTSGWPIAVNIVNGEDASLYVGYDGNGSWEEFTSQAVTGIPTNIILGYEVFGASYVAADWSDVRLQKDVNGVWTTVAHWPLADSPAASLDGYPCFDASGNGYHGTHIGGAGGSGEADILQTAGMDWNGYAQAYAGDISGSAQRCAKTLAVDPTGSGGQVSKLEVTSNSSVYFMVNDSKFITAQSAECSVDVYVPSTNTELSGIWIADGFNNDGNINGEGPASDQWVKISGSLVPASDDSMRIQLDAVSNGNVEALTSSAIGDVIYLRNLTVKTGGTHNKLVFASDSSPSLDALGNAIAKPRVNNKVLNLFDSSCTVEIADDNSLDLINDFTFEAWVDVYGVPDANTNLITKGALLYARKLAVADELTTDFTPATGHAATVTDLLADGISCLHLVQDSVNGFKSFVDTVANASVPAATGDLTANTDPIIIRGADGMHVQVGSLKLYDAILTTDQLVFNYNNQAESFGLAKI